MSRWLNDLPGRWREADAGEKGQMLVVLALAMVGLLAAAGIAVDTGVLLMRQTHLARSIDAAALAGVIELDSSSDPDTALLAANIRGQQLLAANDIILEEETVAVNCADSTSSGFWDVHDYCGQRLDGAIPGSYRYHAEAEWESETYFLRLVGFDTIPIRRAATAEYLTNVDVYASDTAEYGLISDSNLEAFGPDCKSSYGDPYSPDASPWHADTLGVYTYRIRIPENYIYDSLGNVNHDRLRVELFDPDTGNANVNSDTVYYADWSGGGTYGPYTGTCSDSNRADTCLLTVNADHDSESPDPDDEFWFVRVDENRDGVSGDDSSCWTPSYTASRNTRTKYRLYYLAQQSDGSFQEVDLATYIGETDQVSEGRETDLMWISPGVPYDERMPAFSVYDIFGTGSTDTSFSPAEPVTFTEAGNDFLIQLIDHDGRLSETDNIYVDPATGTRDIYLDVTTLSGASENGYHIWAGPPRTDDPSLYEVPAAINARQLYIHRDLLEADPEHVHRSDGILVYGVGHLPMNRNTGARTDVPLAYLGPEFAGQTMSIRVFDNIEGFQQPVYFFFDTVPISDWSACYATSSSYCTSADVGARAEDYHYRTLDQMRLQGDWVTFDFAIPSESADNPDSVPFYGGRLYASYEGDANDTFGWHITLDARPYLVE